MIYLNHNEQVRVIQPLSFQEGLLTGFLLHKGNHVPWEPNFVSSAW